MKCTTVFVVMAVVVGASAMPDRRHQIPPNWGAMPAMTSYVPQRHRRSPVGRLAIDQPINAEPKISAGYVDTFYQNQNGKIVVFGEASKSPDKRGEAVGGIRGEFKFGGSPDLSVAQERRLAEIERLAEAQEARMAEIDRYRKEMKLD